MTKIHVCVNNNFSFPEEMLQVEQENNPFNH